MMVPQLQTAGKYFLLTAVPLNLFSSHLDDVEVSLKVRLMFG